MRRLGIGHSNLYVMHVYLDVVMDFRAELAAQLPVIIPLELRTRVAL